MGDIKSTNLPAEIGQFYDALLDKVMALRSSARERIKSVKKEQEELASKLRESLSKGESLRKKDFNLLMGEIIHRRKEREKEVEAMLEQFHQEEQELKEALKKLFTDGKQVRLRDFKRFIAEFKSKQEERGQDIEEIKRESVAIRKSAEETVAQFREEREEMMKQWQQLAEKMREKRTLRGNLGQANLRRKNV